MNFFSRGIIISFFVFSLLITSHAQDENETYSSILDLAFKDLSFSGQWFLSYQNGEKKGIAYNNFNLKRGYVTLQKKFSKNFSIRVTQDVSVDKEGDGMGDIEIRLKYGYLRYTFDSFGFLTKPFLEVGVVHRPWLDFEQSINTYRVHDKMFLENSGILSSADYGITFSSLLGGTMDDEYKTTVSNKYPGKYGSIAVGIYNGGGYHSIETNQNKFIETRISLRPLPEIIPGLQLSYLGGFGKGNIAEEPDFNFHSGYVSMQHQYFVLTANYFSGTGNEAGDLINSNGLALDSEGYSFFGELKYGDYSLFGRYDFYEEDHETFKSNNDKLSLGFGFVLVKGVKLITAYSQIDYSTSEKPRDYIAEAAIEFNY